MYCPRCARQFDANTSFCRKCGLALDGVDKIVAGDAANAPEVRTRPNFTSMRLGIGLFMFGIVVGLTNAMIRDLDLFPQIYLKIIFFIFLIAGMLSMAYSFVFPKRYYKKRPRGDQGNVGEAEQGLATGGLGQLPSAERDIDDLFSADARREPESVTERTTRHLR